MQLYEHVSLADHSTMRLGGDARYLTIIDDLDDLPEVVGWANTYSLPILTIGDGSNVIFRDSGWDGLVVVMRIKGFEVLRDGKISATIKIGGGENWDNAVKRAVGKRLSGIEALSLIPGTVGAAPVQNIGAYGQELADTFVALEAYNIKKQKLQIFKKRDCHFDYRNSVFKTTEGKQYIITSLTLKLIKKRMKPPFYRSLQDHLDAAGIKDYSPAAIRDAVIAIRNQKLPDPRVIANTGSFFKNPIIKKRQFKALKKTYPDMAGYEVGAGLVKVSAGWLLERAGFKDYRAQNGMGTYEKHALVFVNYSAQSYRDLAVFKKDVQNKVQTLFGIQLEQEPETI